MDASFLLLLAGNGRPWRGGGIYSERSREERERVQWIRPPRGHVARIRHGVTGWSVTAPAVIAPTGGPSFISAF
jgi:hypothetical protein